jgi:predicted RNase H-like HicB family nuclease
MGVSLEKLNRSTAKRLFGEIINKAERGEEIIVIDALRNKGDEKNAVSIISTQSLDNLFSRIAPFKLIWEYDQILKGYTVTIEGLSTVYGEGNTKEEAIEDLIDALLEYTELYYSNIEWFTSENSATNFDFPFLRRIARCNGDREKIKQLFVEEKCQ